MTESEIIRYQPYCLEDVCQEECDEKTERVCRNAYIRGREAGEAIGKSVLET